jgi:hypothetical protein
MSYLTGRERSISRRSVDERTPARSRELSRDESAPERRSTDTDINSLLDQLREGPARMIDALIVELQHQREALLGECVRMHREMIAYAKLNQSTIASTREISETLTSFANQDAPAMNELAQVVSGRGDRKAASEKFAERDASRLLKARASAPLAPEE